MSREEKLTFENLAPYLPYGLIAEMIMYKCDYVGKKYDIIKGVEQWSKNGDWCLLTEGGSKPPLDKIKPILRPLSDLTKEIEVDGEKFVPLIELCKIYLPDECRLGVPYTCNGYTITYGGLTFGYTREEGFCVSDKDYHDLNQLTLFKKLYKWHFDLEGLIEKGLAISYNEIK
jgi:hypothetical protein